MPEIPVLLYSKGTGIYILDIPIKNLKKHLKRDKMGIDNYIWL